MAQAPPASSMRPGTGGRVLSFEGGTGFLLARAGSLARRQWARMLSDRDLTPHHYGVLMALQERGPLGQQQLAELIGVDPRNAVPVIDALVDRGLLVRAVHPNDRRRRVLSLTEPGLEAAVDLARSGAELEEHFFGGLTDADRRRLHRTLLDILSAADDR